jgi:hypothetical protein
VFGAGSGLVIGALGGGDAGASSGMHVGVFTGLAFDVAVAVRRR